MYKHTYHMTNAVVTIQKLGQKLNVQPITTNDCADDDGVSGGETLQKCHHE